MAAGAEQGGRPVAGARRAVPVDAAVRDLYTALMETMSSAAPAPETCQTMEQVRAGVDAVDRALVKLLAQRQGYMEAAARIKPDRSSVRDEARIEQVLSNVQQFAWENGLSWQIAEPVWRLLVERCIAHEFEVFDQVRGGGVF